jgi:hypothetical protein
MKNPQDILNAWRAFMFIISVPVIMMLLWYAINPKDFDRWKSRSPVYQNLPDSNEMFVRIVCVITAICIMALLVEIAVMRV